MLGNGPRHAIGLRPRIPNRCWRTADVMRRMGIEALYRRPRTTKPEPGRQDLSVSRCAASRSGGRTRSGPWTSRTFRWRTGFVSSRRGARLGDTRLAVVEGASIRASAYDLADLWLARDCDPDEIVREMICGVVLLSQELGPRPWSVRKIHVAVDIYAAPSPGKLPWFTCQKHPG